MPNIQKMQKAAGGSGAQHGAQLGADTQGSGDALGRINRDLEERATSDRAKDLNLPYVDVAKVPVNPDILHLISPDDAVAARIMPFFRAGKKVRVAVADPDSAAVQEVLKKLEAQGFSVQAHIASNSGIADALKMYASEQYKAKTEIKNIVEAEEIHYEKELENLAQIKDKISVLSAEEALNTLNVSAIKAGASDIHYQPEETFAIVRFRIDGVLHTVFEITPEVYTKLASQLKYKAKMKLNVATEPQDGRFRFIVNDRKIDVRVSSLPTEFGEAFVCRILDSGKHFSSFEELGFIGKSLEILNKASGLAQGMVLCCGPTSAGKTTTLYVLLNKFNKPETKIITLEDPIEYHLRGVTQSQVDEKRGYNFASGLRSVLRQDPNVVMIGEIRDLATAEVCAQAALTGHTVLSTLHTKSAVDAIPRLITIGLPAFMIAPAISTVISQRLVRKLCKKCAAERAVFAEEKELLEKTLGNIKAVDFSCKVSVPAKLKKAKGCDDCNATGFRGQFVISEVLHVDDEIGDAILKNKSVPEIFALARKTGMLTMFEDGVLKAISGLTTLEEIHRVTSA